ncbi:hypothetical protein DITRI_Ditri08aG0049700 [Diplodiscus trichospermus]
MNVGYDMNVSGMVSDLERPFVSDVVDLAQDQNNDLTRDYDLEGEHHQNEALLRSPRTQGLVHKQRLPFASPHLSQANSTANDLFCMGDSLVVEVIPDPSEDILLTCTSRLPLTFGRVSPSDLLLKDSEVSGKQEMIDWNSNPINHPDSGSRHWGYPTELVSGDTITLGTTSNIYVHISSQNDFLVPFGVGMTSNLMSLRRGRKKPPMEDFVVFGICDGHGGVEAAKFTGKLVFLCHL